MSEMLQAVRGMNDIVPQMTPRWRALEALFSECLLNYGYQEIRFPIVESTQLFQRSIGDVTDIVEKEMYTFQDLNGDSLTLRPEGTAGCLRACLEHGLLHNQQQKLWYAGPMFRHEKPQKGRYRQFFQFGVEALGIPGAAIELELIAICLRLWKALGLENAVKLQINTLGELEERQRYKQNLVAFLQQHFDKLDDDCKRRLHTNPLRILDSKNPEVQALLADAPTLVNSLGEASKLRFDAFCEGLRRMGIDYEINPFLVRGLDYYGHTVFEWVTDQLGSQATLCAGGRYDALVEQLGGNALPAVGFAMGAERLLLLMETIQSSLTPKKRPGLFIITVEAAMQEALLIAEELHNTFPHCCVMTNTSGGGFKSQFKKADKSGADFALIIAEDELNTDQVSIKNLRKSEEQVTISRQQLCRYLQDHLGEK